MKATTVQLTPTELKSSCHLAEILAKVFSANLQGAVTAIDLVLNPVCDCGQN